MTAREQMEGQGVIDAVGVVFGRWRLVRFNSLCLALYRRNGDGSWQTCPTYHMDAGSALRCAASADARDAVAESGDARALARAWESLAARVALWERMLHGRTLPMDRGGDAA